MNSNFTVEIITGERVDSQNVIVLPELDPKNYLKYKFMPEAWSADRFEIWRDNGDNTTTMVHLMSSSEVVVIGRVAYRLVPQKPCS